jgi:hypothetical protein
MVKKSGTAAARDQHGFKLYLSDEARRWLKEHTDSGIAGQHITTQVREVIKKAMKRKGS